MDQNYVNVPYNEFQALSYHSYIYSTAKRILLDETIPLYTKEDMLRVVFGYSTLKKEEA